MNSQRVPLPGWRLALLAVVGSVWSLPAFAGAPVVSDVRATQRAGTGLVDIYYDLADPDGDHAAVTVSVSFNSGVTYNELPRSLTGPGYGRDIAPGNDLHIVWDAGADLDPVLFRNVRIKITADDGAWNAGPELCYIPAGSFQMGGYTGQLGTKPTHGVFVSAFYMDKYEVSGRLWDEVYRWAIGHGYTFDNPAMYQGPDHPVQSVTWYDVVKWCNARSEMRGLTPAYYTDPAQRSDQVYRTGVVNPTEAMVKWSANGYRLPTEAEWEKAARGGLSGHYYPWPSMGGSREMHLNGSKANYSGSGDPFEGASPATTPVGYYNGGQVPAGVDMANGYGLYDMAGNVWEWVWDWYDSGWYERLEASADNTRGPASGVTRVYRGGSCAYYYYDHLLCAERQEVVPRSQFEVLGFRCARGL